MSRRMRTSLFLLGAWALGAASSPPADACTHFQLKSKDASVVIGRSMEFGPDLKSGIVAVPKGFEFASTAPGGGTGLKWKGRYGFFGMNAYALPKIVDGINEAGLGVGFLWLPDSQYQAVPAGQEAKALALVDFGNWLLSQFATVDEVKQALPGILVWGEIVPQLGLMPPLHAAIHDAQGNAIVVEFVGGQAKVYDNPMGVLTNAPPFDWQIANLRNYVNLTPTNAATRTVAGIKLVPTGQGSGLLGMPGDWTPPSRFVRAAILSHAADPGATFDKTIETAFHILNTFDIPRGIIRDAPNVPLEYTQWIVVKDLSHRSISFRSYDDWTIRRIDAGLLQGLTAPAIKNLDLKAAPVAKVP